MIPVNPAPKLLDGLPSVLMSKIESLLDNPGPLSHTNRVRALNYRTKISHHYQSVFGEINKTFQSDANTMKRLLYCGERQPDASKNYKVYRAQTGLFERLKWLAGVDNRQDRAVQDLYNKNIQLLENTQATSISQLQYQLRAFWRSDQIIKDYAQFKSSEQARVINTRTKKIIFCVLRFFLRCRYNLSRLNFGRNLGIRAQETFAKIGNFSLGAKDYDVVAFHPLSDRNYGNTDHQFLSLYSGRTFIGILESNQLPHTFRGFDKELYGGRRELKYNFSILIGRNRVYKSTKGVFDAITSEATFDPPTTPVTNNRHLVIDRVVYRDGTWRKVGSDRLLDQKLTQIMVELSMQNKEIISTQVKFNRTEFMFPIASGFAFSASIDKGMIEELSKFRAIEGNNLFPSVEADAIERTGTFTPEGFRKKNVYFSREGAKSWSEIIGKKPILKPNSGILPEYWAMKPNIYRYT